VPLPLPVKDLPKTTVEQQRRENAAKRDDLFRNKLILSPDHREPLRR
jgi:hypothetical protein